MKKLLCLLGGAMLVIQLNAQKIKPLSIGDEVPDIVLNNIINYSMPELKLSDFKGKLIIFDFWATWCGACIEELPRLQELQSKYGDKIQVVAVTHQNYDIIHSFFDLKVHDNLKWLNYPFVTSDSNLHILFNVNRSYPTEIWVDKNGVFIAKTKAKYVTDSNIDRFLNDLPIKVENLSNEPKKIFSVKNNPLFMSKLNYPLWYSGFSNYMDENVNSGLHRVKDSSGNSVRYDFINSDLVSLASWALNIPHPLTAKECLLDVSDTSHFFYTADLGNRDKWKRNNTYCFEIVLPKTGNDSLARKKLLSDLFYYKGIKASIVQKIVKCLVIKDKYPTKKAKSKSHYYASSLNRDSSGYFRYKLINNSVYPLVNLFNKNKIFYNFPLVLNETSGRRITMYLDLGQSPNDINSWKRELDRYGLVLVPEERMLNILKIKKSKTDRYYKIR